MPVQSTLIRIPEACNAAWKKLRRGDISRVQGEAVMAALASTFDRLAPAAPLLQPFMANREHPLGNPSPARVMAGVAAQL